MPIQTWDSAGNLLFDSDAVANGVCLGAFRVAGGSSFSKSFPLLAGASVRVMGLTGDMDLSGVSVSYPGSVPTVTASATALTRYFVLWATGTPSIVSGAGLQAVSSGGTIALSPNARGCNYLGKATVTGTTTSTGSPNAGGDLGYVTYTITGAANPPVVVLEVTSSRFSAIRRGPISLGGTSWTVDVQSVATRPNPGDTSWPTLLQPELHVFTPPNAPGSGPQAALYDTDGTLAYDLLAGRLLVTAGPLSFPSGTGSDDYFQTLPSGVSTTRCGIFGVPFYNEIRSVRRTATSFQQRTLAALWTLASGQLQRARTIVSTLIDIDPVTQFNEQSAICEVVSLSGI